MFFTDDCYIFCKADSEEANRNAYLLKVFERVSIQKKNVKKSSVSFSRNVKDDTKSSVCGVIRFGEAGTNDLYLGLPNLWRDKLAILGYLKERVQDRVKSWDGKILTKAGKEILLKAVA